MSAATYDDKPWFAGLPGVPKRRRQVPRGSLTKGEVPVEEFDRMQPLSPMDPSLGVVADAFPISGEGPLESSLALVEPSGRSLQCLRPFAVGRVGGDHQFLGEYHRPGPMGRAFGSIGADIFPVPCGSCLHCRGNQRAELSIRAYHEVLMTPHKVSWVATLTYRDADLPQDGSLVPGHLEKFMRDVRYRFGAMRFMACGEYGDQFGRAHFHVILFGADLDDCRKISSTSYSSRKLDAVWGRGTIELQVCNLSAIKYVAGYCLKKLVQPRNADRRKASVFQKISSDLFIRREVLPPFGRSSRKPGLGAMWADEFHERVLESGTIIIEGKETRRVPSYYVRRWKQWNPPGLQNFLEQRRAFAESKPKPLSFSELIKSGEQTAAERKQRALDRFASGSRSL